MWSGKFMRGKEFNDNRIVSQYFFRVNEILKYS